MPASGTPLNCASCHNPAAGFTDGTIGNLTQWMNTADPENPLRPTSQSSTPLDAEHRIKHLHFDHGL